jgi:hypothetical protein
MGIDCFPLQHLALGLIGAEAAAAELLGRGGIRPTFATKQRALYYILQSGRMAAVAPALRQLIARLNFNGWAERQALAAQGHPDGAGASAVAAA